MMGQKILLVDDEPGIRKVLSISLEDIGYDVVTAQNGEEALHFMEKTRPLIVLTDIKMPGMDGIELLQRIKKGYPDTEVIMITGHGEMELAIQSLKFDATDFITKPIHDDALEIALKRANEKIILKTQIKNYTENLENLVEEKSRKLIEAEHLATVGQTVAGLAHAIKNLAGGLTGGAFVLEKGIDLDNKTYLRQGWDMVKGNLARIKNMTLDLLNYTKEREPDQKFWDPNKPVREVYDLMLSRAHEYDVALDLNLDKSLPDVWIDIEAIHRCIMNLVTNAIDACTDINCHTKNSKVVIHTLKAEGWAVEYQVVDNGCGMDEETKGKIFERFFSTKGTKGTGLGLMLTKKNIDEHNGIIEIESEKEKGTKVIVKLPEKEKR